MPNKVPAHWPLDLVLFGHQILFAVFSEVVHTRIDHSLGFIDGVHLGHRDEGDIVRHLSLNFLNILLYFFSIIQVGLF